MYFIFETIYKGKKSGGVCVSKTLAGARIKAMMVHKITLALCRAL